MRLRPFVALLLAALLGAGCVEEDVQVVVQPDGRGTVQLKVRLRADLSKEDIAKGQEGLDKRAASVLSGWKGITAWSDVAVAAEEERVVITAKGWFEDPTALEGDDLHQLEVKRAEGRLELRLRMGLKGGKKQEADPRLITMTDEEFLKQRKERQQMVDAMLQQFTLEVVYWLPGDATADPADAFEQKGPMSRVRLTGDAVRRDYGRFLDEAARLRAEVQLGNLHPDAAATKLTEFEAAITPSAWRKLTCPLRAPQDEERAEFERGLTAAKEAWAASPWKARLEQARESR